ncbi:MAG: prepilin-type N-terminal cleavage/methylation domain-containing protein [Thermoguttaceae bacterium]|nr:prepilin-type N-terminal cleavage/methylation domain-containing protein [Thermoguttaceae bacterium]MBQ8363464.1 prepilin-type N-terminal cleavage/methylation domain-containing protein [Thermoguttaceae bacterium]
MTSRRIGRIGKTGVLHRRGNRGGFTLLEILVAFAILIMGLSIVAALATTSARQAVQVEEETGVQLACQNLMNAILAGDATVSLGVEIPLPDVPNWAARVELLDGPISNLVAIRIVATRFEIIETPHPTDPTLTISTRSFEGGRRYVLKEWARRADVRTQTVRRNVDGTFSTVDGSAADIPASNVANGSGVAGNVAGGLSGFDSASGDAFGELDGAFGDLGETGNVDGFGATGTGSLASPFSELDAATQNLNEPTFAPPSPF